MERTRTLTHFMMNAHKAMGTYAICCISLHGELKKTNYFNMPLHAVTQKRISIQHGAGGTYQSYLADKLPSYIWNRDGDRIYCSIGKMHD